MRTTKMKGIGIEQLAPIAIIFVVAFFIFSIGSIVMTDLSEEFCDATWLDTNYCKPGVTTCNATTANPVTGDRWGCCTTLNASQDCTAWSTSKTAANISQSGNEAIEEMASWGPTLALVLVAAIIIGVLITYLARGSSV